MYQDDVYKETLPKFEAFSFLGWDGTRVEKDINKIQYDRLNGIGIEKNSNASNKNYTAVKKEISSKEVTTIKKGKEVTEIFYDLDVDSYNKVGFDYQLLNDVEFFCLQAYQEKANVQIFFPLPDYHKKLNDANVWYQLEESEATKVYAASGVYGPLAGNLAKSGEYKCAYIGNKNEFYNNYYGSKIDGDDGTYTYPPKPAMAWPLKWERITQSV